MDSVHQRGHNAEVQAATYMYPRVSSTPSFSLKYAANAFEYCWFSSGLMLFRLVCA